MHSFCRKDTGFSEICFVAVSNIWCLEPLITSYKQLKNRWVKSLNHILFIIHSSLRFFS